MKVYKVVSHIYRTGRMFSFNASVHFPDYVNIEYKIGERAVPILQNSLLFCFTSLYDAARFSLGVYPILECEGEGVIELLPVFSDNIEDYWMSSPDKRRQFVSVHVRCSMGATAITPLRVVSVEDLESDYFWFEYKHYKQMFG